MSRDMQLVPTARLVFTGAHEMTNVTGPHQLYFTLGMERVGEVGEGSKVVSQCMASHGYGSTTRDIA